MGKFEQHNFFRKTALTTFWAMCGEIGLLFSLSSGRTACTHECIMHQASVSNDTFFFFFSPDVSFDQICNKSEALKNSNIKFLSAPPALPHVLLPTSDKFEWCRATCGGQDHYLPQFHKSIFSFKSFSLSVHFEPLSAALSKVSQFTFFEMIDYDEVFKEKTSFLCLRSNFALRAFRH